MIMQSNTPVSDSELWPTFSRTNDPEQLGQTWLAIVLNQFSQRADIAIQDGLLAVGQPASADYKTVAFTSNGAKSSAILKQVGEQAMQRLAPVVQSEEQKGLYFLACPLVVENQLYGVVILSLKLNHKSLLTKATEIVQWSIPVLVQRLTPSNQYAIATEDSNSPVFSLLEQINQPVPIADMVEWVCTEQLKRFGLTRCVMVIADDKANSLLQVGTYTGELESKSETEVIISQAREALLQGNGPNKLSDNSDNIGLQLKHQDQVSWADWFTQPLTYRESTVHVLWLVSCDKVPTAAIRDQIQQTLFTISSPLVSKYFEQQSLTRTLTKSTKVKLSNFFRNRKKTPITLGTFILLAAFLFWPVNYQVVADAKIVGAERRVISAPFDGYISKVAVRPGDELIKDQLMFSLDDKELELQKLDLKAKFVEVSRQMDAARGEYDIAKSNILAASQKRVEAEIRLINHKLSRTQILSSLDNAIVVSGDLIDAIGTPVRQGEVLAELSPLNQYKLLIEVEQLDIGYIALDQLGKALLTPIPNQPFEFTVSRVTPIAQAKDGKTVFRVEGVLQGDVSDLRPGMDGVAKVETVSQPRVWNWTRKLWAWVSIKTWVLMP
ncbi:hypothetical protein A1QI_17675 [Vibrio genomosp. F10 str. 9ZB36]|nr:hypothetical protein A1QI_17675 [Vibrio genomosp. F10 str. 9ZB36]